MAEPTLNDVLEEMRTTHEAMKTYVDEKYDEMEKRGDNKGTAETEAKIVAVNEELTELRGKYDEMMKAGQRPSSEDAGALANEEGTTEEIELRKNAFEKFVRYGAGETGRAMMSSEEIRALSSASDADGGFLVPPSFENDVLMNAYNEAELRPICQVGNTSRDSVNMPALSKPVVGWGTQNVAVDPQDLNAGGEKITIFDLKALTLLHNNTLDDAEADVWGELQDAFQMAIAEAEDDAFAAAAGNNSPQGVLGHSGVVANVHNTGVAAALSDATHNGIDILITALYNLKKTYRRNATWAMNSITESLVRQFKDGNGQYLWQPPVQAGAPATLLGRPMVNPEGMPDVAANALPIAVGDFRKGYKIRDRASITVQRLVERYAEYDQTGFLIKRRTGGQVVLPEAFRVIKVAT